MYELVPERIEWHLSLINKLQEGSMSLTEANLEIVETMAKWFGAIEHKVVFDDILTFKTEVSDFRAMNPRLNITVLNNKVIGMLRNLKTADQATVEKEVFLHFEDLKRIFAELQPKSETYNWTYAINPRLVKIYREFAEIK